MILRFPELPKICLFLLPLVLTLQMSCMQRNWVNAGFTEERQRAYIKVRLFMPLLQDADLQITDVPPSCNVPQRIYHE